MKRSGYTVVEVLVAMSAALTALGLISGLVTHSARASAQAGASEEAVRGLSLALETIKRDVRRLVVLNPKEELAIARDGRALAMRIPRSRGNDFWGAQVDVVEYGLSGTKLMRRDPMGPRAIAGCQLTDVEFRFIKAGAGSRHAGYLSVTLLGPPPPKGGTRLTATALVPVTRITTPLPFRV